MRRFNLSQWAVNHQPLMLFFILAIAIGGFLSYQRLGRAEDPNFTIKAATITAIWPGATAQEMQDQVADRIEKKLQELPFFNKVQTYTKPSFTAMTMEFKDNTRSAEMPQLFYQLRKKLQDLRADLPANLIGPNVNDEFGDVDSILYTLSGADYAQLKQVAEGFRRRLLRAPNVVKVNIYGAQDEKIFVEFSHAKLATLGIPAQAIFDSLQKQNAQDVQTAQESLDSALLAQKKGLASDKKSVQSAKEQVASLQASDASVSTSAGTISADQAAIEVAKAGLEEAQSNLSATVLRSPVKGTVAAIDVEKGDTVSAGTTVATILPKASYQIVSSFSEADALKLAVGQKATVTFDALSETAEGTVTEVDILPTSSTSGTTSSVTTYNATITIDKAPDDVRQGMSASVVVTTDEASDVLWVPSAAVTTAGGVSTVTVRTNGVDSTVTVETGLEGDSGTEITSGLSEGQQVVIDTSSTESSSTSGFPAGGGLGFAGGGQGGPPAGGGR